MDTNEERPIDVAARTFYTRLTQLRHTPKQVPPWDALSKEEQMVWATAFAYAHKAYYDQENNLRRQALLGRECVDESRPVHVCNLF